jgi:hypothetical protein
LSTLFSLPFVEVRRESLLLVDEGRQGVVCFVASGAALVQPRARYSQDEIDGCALPAAGAAIAHLFRIARWEVLLAEKRKENTQLFYL